MSAIVYNDVWADGIDIDPYFSGTFGKLSLGQRLIRRLFSQRGSHPLDEEYGTDIKGWLGRNFTADEVNVFETAAEIECEKEVLVLSVECSISVDDTQDVDTFALSILVRTEEEDFTITIQVGSPIGGSTSDVMSSTTNYREVVVNLTDTAEVVLASNSKRVSMKIQNDNGVDVYRHFGTAPTSASFIIGRYQNEPFGDGCPQGALYMMCKPGETATIKIEEFYN